MEENNSVTDPDRSGEVNLQTENDFLKMKMMLEHGAEFGSSKDLPPEIENQFLKSVMDFENQFQKAGRIKVFDKVGRPKQFRPVNEIPDEDIEKEWIELYEFLHEHDIDLGVCSPNVGPRELYRFTTEELFELETDNISLPGLTNWFIYDEFHPDHIYENSRIAVDECISYFFNKNSFYDHHFAKRVRVNNHSNLSKAELKFVVQNFKHDYDQIVPVHIRVKECKILNNNCLVNGHYEVAFIIREKSSVKKGDWSVKFTLNKDLGYWYINDVQIKGIKIP